MKQTKTQPSKLKELKIRDTLQETENVRTSYFLQKKGTTGGEKVSPTMKQELAEWSCEDRRSDIKETKQV